MQNAPDRSSNSDSRFESPKITDQGIRGAQNCIVRTPQ